MIQNKLWYKHLPYVHPYYAVKCNPDHVLLEWLYKNYASFDCASSREMFLVQKQFGKQNVGKHILFANPCKTSSDITYAKELKVPWVTADSVEEFVKMDEAGYRPDVLLRIAVDDSDSACPFGAKFGLQPNEVHNVLRAIRTLKIPVVGLSFHVGSGSKSPRAYRVAIDESKQLWKSLQKEKLVTKFMTLDIGGGWSHEEDLFAKQAYHTNEGLKEGSIIPNSVIAEPGRFFAAPVYDLYVRVVGKKPRNGGGWRYTIDESIYGQFSCIPFDHAKPRIARIRSNDNELPRKKTAATIFGRTCDSLDWIANSDSMEELEVGDWLYVPNMGAYTASTSTEFNGFPKPEILGTELFPNNKDLFWIESIKYPLASMLTVP
jgi:ornithine decarboxylase